MAPADMEDFETQVAGLVSARDLLKSTYAWLDEAKVTRDNPATSGTGDKTYEVVNAQLAFNLLQALCGPALEEIRAIDPARRLPGEFTKALIDAERKFTTAMVPGVAEISLAPVTTALMALSQLFKELGIIASVSEVRVPA